MCSCMERYLFSCCDRVTGYHDVPTGHCAIQPVMALQQQRRRRAVVALTPRQRFRHDEPSWFFSGHTTSLVASETENELVREDRGGIPSCCAPDGRSGEGAGENNATATSSQTTQWRDKKAAASASPAREAKMQYAGRARVVVQGASVSAVRSGRIAVKAGCGSEG